MLNLLEPYDLRSMGAGSAEAIHLMIETKKLAYEDRARFCADPERAAVPVQELISKSYAARRGTLIDRSRASSDPCHGNPLEADTVYLTVVDTDHNAGTLTRTTFKGFACHHC